MVVDDRRRVQSLRRKDSELSKKIEASGRRKGRGGEGGRV